jgi:poly-gamma-glutamate synthesis protein (capsule biosynthesis protein)
VDWSQAGIDSTIRALDAAGVRHTGVFRSAAARSRPLILDVRGAKVAFLAYTRHTNGRPLPHPWSVNLARGRRIVADVRRARERGATVVIVNVHWGGQFDPHPNRQQYDLARRLASHGVTALVGQGPHLVQPIRRVRGMPVVFSDGNLLSYQGAPRHPAAAQDGLIALINVVVRERRARVARISYVPIFVRHPDHTVLPLGRAARRGELDRATARDSYKRTVAAVGRRPGIRPIPARAP